MSIKIDLVIPTLWKFHKFYEEYLQRYINSSFIENIIIIDNNKSFKPNNDLFNNQKIKLFTSETNIFVGPSWNKGVEIAETDIVCLLNDDIFIEDEIFEYISNIDFTDIDIIGNNHNSNNTNIILEKFNHDKYKPLGEQCYGFGSCMFFKKEKYKPIPNDYQILFTDDYLVQNSENIYVLNTNKIVGTMSNTLNVMSKDKQILERMSIDIYNGKNFLIKK